MRWADDRLEGGMPPAVAIIMLSVGTDEAGEPLDDPKRTLVTHLGGRDRLLIDHRISPYLVAAMTRAEIAAWLEDEHGDAEGQVRR